MCPFKGLVIEGCKKNQFILTLLLQGPCLKEKREGLECLGSWKAILLLYQKFSKGKSGKDEQKHGAESLFIVWQFNKSD
ncbi:hypothetical protein L6452_32208 [Arctium lappa]|uniref:Uncharacterized protein n=1 Tax=Arctium lappa TaxID=4217 RepID=A0ACB8Z4B9_ARCLA|nr:hypothetical protein L6452_32208 [Arctium lappa]